MAAKAQTLWNANAILLSGNFPSFIVSRGKMEQWVICKKRAWHGFVFTST